MSKKLLKALGCETVEEALREIKRLQAMEEYFEGWLPGSHSVAKERVEAGDRFEDFIGEDDDSSTEP